MIKKVYYDWFGGQLGEGFRCAEIGEKGVVKIVEHQAMGEGDKWYYDIIHEDGSILRIFNPNKAELEETE